MSDKHVAIVMSEVFLRRLTPALVSFVRKQQDFRIVSIHRPVSELIDLLGRLSPAGLITEWLPKVTDQLLALNIPTVIADTDFIYPKVVSVDVDDYAVGMEAAEAFMNAGYKSFACLGNGAPYSEQRIEGFIEGIGEHVEFSGYSVAAFEPTRYSEHFSEADAGLIDWLLGLPQPVGIFAVHDPLGRFLCETCRRLSLSVPEQVAVIGANNDELVCGLSYPMLSSVRIPWDTLGEVVGEHMLRLINGEPSPKKPILVSPSSVVLRHSANHLAVEDPLVRRVMSYFSDRLEDSISVGRMCDELRLARRSVERRFKDQYQATPAEMLCRLRVNRAKQLLAGTNHPISMIAGLSGFNDPERMATVFKRVAGIRPSDYRKNL